MTRYLMINAAISAAILLALPLLRTAPHRLKLYLCGFAAILWLTPLYRWSFDWPWAEAPAPLTLALAASVQVLAMEPAASGVDWRSWLWLAPAIGMAWFLRDLVVNHRQIHALSRSGRDGSALWARLPAGLRAPDLALRIIPGRAGAMASGLRRPTIWIGEAHLRGDEWPCVLAHELTHIRHKDNYWQLALGFTERLMWWNPLVRLLTRRARLYIELSCDQRCQRLLRPGEYQAGLAQALLHGFGFGAAPAAMASGIRSSTSIDLLRVKALERSFKMKSVHLLVVGSIVLGSLSLFGAMPSPLATASSEPAAKVKPVKPEKPAKLKPAAKAKEKPSPKLKAKEKAKAKAKNKQAEKAKSAIVVKPVVMTAANVDQMPIFTRKIAPAYPESAKASKVATYVILEAVLKADGVIEQIKKLRPKGDDEHGFAEAAITALKQWQYEPATVNGKPVDVRMTLKINFELE